MIRHAELADIELPDFEVPVEEPLIPAKNYMHRLDLLRDRARDLGFDYFIVYGDREHFANTAYLTGFDPRFEESLLIVDASEREAPAILVGNEGMGYLDISPIRDGLRGILFQGFSLMGQERGESRSIRQILLEEGLDKNVRVGVAGWKYFTPQEDPDYWTLLEIPSYIADTLRALCGFDNVRNGGSILMDSSRGLRVVNDVDQLAWFEYAASHTSQAVRDMIFGLRPGMTEHDAVRLMRLNALPLSAHLMLSSGPRAFIGLPSPSSRRIERGDPFTTAYGVWGALNSRAGFVVEDATELPMEIRDYVAKLVAPYYEAIAGWYECVGVGVTGGELYKVVHDRIGDPSFGVKLNPGHLIHLDEWVNSPIYEASSERLVSGMALQVDVIPSTGTPYFTTNIEDGIALADAKLREEFSSKYPDAWGRIEARRNFMEESLGISLGVDVLPFSNIPAYLPPFLLAPNRAMRISSG
jgi:hypothetical protein